MRVLRLAAGAGDRRAGLISRSRRRHTPTISHEHPHAPHADRRRLAIALTLIVGFMAFEVAFGVVANSLALLSDAAHMLTDAVAIAVSIMALGLAARPAQGQMTFGFRRAEILAAQFNGATLLVLGGLIVYDGVRRLISPPHVTGATVLIVALVGIAVNLAATRTLSGANRQSLNVEGAFQHILTDLAAFIATAVAGAVILSTGYFRADGIASLLVAAIMLRAAYGLLRASGRIFLEAAPHGLDVQAVGRAMAGFAGVHEIHDLHVWEVSSGFPALSAHVLVGEGDDCHQVRRELERLLADRFGIDHTTLQVEHAASELISIGQPERTRG